MPNVAIRLHPENAKLGTGLLGAAAQRCLQTQPKHMPRLRRRDDTIIP